MTAQTLTETAEAILDQRVDLLGPRGPRRVIREIQGLRWASFSQRGPIQAEGGGRRRRTRAQARGLAYERRLKRPLRRFLGPEYELLHGQWIVYKDANGIGRAQPDFLGVGSGFLWIFEAKLTWTEAARTQLLKLYGPLLKHIYPDLHQIRVAVCKHLTPSAPCPVARLEDTFDTDQEMYLWHFLG